MSKIVKTITCFVSLPIIVFGLYIISHGHLTPGGGFAGGAMIATFVGCGLMYFMTYTQFGQKGLAQDILELYFPISKDYAKILTPIFLVYLKYYSLLGVDSIDKKTNRLSFLVTFKQKSKLLSFSNFKKSRDLFEDKLTPKAALLTEIQQFDYVTNVKVIEGSSSVEI